MTATCPRCTRPVATAAEWAHPDGCECDRCLAVCYGDGCAEAAARLPDEVVRLRAELAAAQQRLRRHEHGTTIEGDHVCAAELWQANVEPLIEAVRAELYSGGDALKSVERLLAVTAKEGKTDA